MIVIGIDVHKRSHTLVAIDAQGRRLSVRTVNADPAGHAAALAWAHELPALPDDQLVWAVEDCRGFSLHLEADLLASGARVVRVPSKLMARVRASVRTPGKSDPIDALAVARAALREPDLPAAVHDPVVTELRILVDHRRDLVRRRTAVTNRAHHHLHLLDPELATGIAARGLHKPTATARLRDTLSSKDSVLAVALTDMLSEISDLGLRIAVLDEQLADRVQTYVPALSGVPGCGVVTAATIMSRAGDPTRFHDADAFAVHTGTAPIPVWSGATAGKVRVNRGGERQLNASLHTIALTQARMPGPGRDYYLRKIAEGKTRREALRCLKRRLARVVYQRLLKDHAARSDTPANISHADAA